MLLGEPEDKLSEVQGLASTLKMFRHSIDSFMALTGDKLSKEEEEYMGREDHLFLEEAGLQGQQRKPMDEEQLGDAGLDAEEEAAGSEVASSEQQRDPVESRVLGIEFPAQFNNYIDEQLFKQLRNELYSKDNAMKMNEALNFNVGSPQQVYNPNILKGFNTIDSEESIKYFRENFDLDLRDTGKSFVIYENVEVKPADMYRLCPAVFLNDTTINFYIKIISKYILHPSRGQDFHFFNTYFFSKLRSEVNAVCAQQDLVLSAKSRDKLQEQMDQVHKRIKNVRSVHQWHKKIKLFHKKYILIPVNKKDHWYTVIIVNLPSLFECFTKRKDPSLLPAEEKPYILLLDPLVTAEESIDLIIRLYLECELKEVIGPAYDLMVANKADLSQEARYILEEDNLPHYQLIVAAPDQIPRQRNTYDCGVYALEYMESFVLNPHFIVDKLSEKKDFSNWFPRSLINNKRKQIITFLINHSKGMAIEVPSAHQQNVDELLKQRYQIIEAKKDDPDEFDVLNEEEVLKSLPPGAEEEGDEEKSRLFVRTYYSIVPKEILQLCQLYFEQNFSAK